MGTKDHQGHAIGVHVEAGSHDASADYGELVLIAEKNDLPKSWPGRFFKKVKASVAAKTDEAAPADEAQPPAKTEKKTEPA